MPYLIIRERGQGEARPFPFHENAALCEGAPLDDLLFYADASVFDHFPEAVEGGFRISEAVVPAFLGVAVVFRAGDEFLVFIFSRIAGTRLAISLGERLHEVHVADFGTARDVDAVLNEHLLVVGEVVAGDDLGGVKDLFDAQFPLADEGLACDHGRGDVIHRFGAGPAGGAGRTEIFVHHDLAQSIYDGELQDLG